MMRKILVVGDRHAHGHILIYTPPFSNRILGHQVAIIGGRVYCETCSSAGRIAKAGGPRRMGYLTGVALEGDMCVCNCPKPHPLVSTLQSISSHDDMDGGRFAPEMAAGGLLPLLASDDHLAASKIVDEQVEHPPEAEITENICPNMTNEAFVELVLALRDEAVAPVTRRAQELERWDKAAHARILEWFGDPGLSDRAGHLNSLRNYLSNGLKSCERVLLGLKAENFVRWSPNAHRHIACSNVPPRAGLAAQVCKPDVKTHTIAIGVEFCRLRRDTRIFGTDSIRDGDSQLFTILHEVTHFDDVFSSTDEWPGTQVSRAMVTATKQSGIARINADSLTGYIAGAKDI